eukprot:TRINITY_DN1218_c0_g2_i18.p1 TRINITY_DN1218_c0_g2~~TRINITY_DN1218_c0_g2_i18.p1  ORF type:complete len:250 (-),score=34.64 TRINITY_DN1218_c0_g2_i18:481-1230(-)
MQGVEDTRLKRRVVVVGIAGASGSGKSSLANHLADLYVFVSLFSFHLNGIDFEGSVNGILCQLCAHLRFSCALVVSALRVVSFHFHESTGLVDSDYSFFPFFSFLFSSFFSFLSVLCLFLLFSFLFFSLLSFLFCLFCVCFFSLFFCSFFPFFSHFFALLVPSVIQSTHIPSFESPVIPISGDWFFDKKKMPKGLDGHLNWETPEGIDWESFSENLTRVKKQLETEETVPYSINIERPGFFFFSLFPNI